MQFDVIVVLAGGLSDSGGLPAQVVQRVQLAYSFYVKRLAPRIVMSGRWSSYWEHFPPSRSEASLMRAHAISLGVPGRSILTEEHSHSTFENAFYVTKLFLEPNNWKRVLVVTSDYHVARARQTFITLLGDSYYVEVRGAHISERLIRRITWRIREMFLLPAQWLVQYVRNRI